MDRHRRSLDFADGLRLSPRLRAVRRCGRSGLLGLRRKDHQTLLRMKAWSGGAGLASSSAALGLSCPCRALSLCEVFFLPEADAAYSAFAFNASVVAVQVRFCRCDQPGALLRVFSCRRWFRPIVVSGRLLPVCSVFPPRPGRKHLHYRYRYCTVALV